MLFELRRKCKMCFIVFGNDQKTARIFIDTVHDAGANHPSNTRKRRSAMIQQCIDKCARGVTCGRMHDHSNGFVYNNDVIILKNDIQGNIFGQSLRGFRLGQSHFYRVSFIELIVFCHRFAVYGNRSLFDESCGGRTCQFCTSGDKLIQTCAFILCLCFEAQNIGFGIVIPHRHHSFPLPFGLFQA